MQLPQSSRKRGREFRGAEDSHEQRRRYGLVAPVVSPYGGRDDAFALLSAVHKIESALSRIDIVLPIQSAVGLTEPLASVVRVSLDIRDLICDLRRMLYGNASSAEIHHAKVGLISLLDQIAALALPLTAHENPELASRFETFRDTIDVIAVRLAGSA